jgi:hypothetical protein
MNLFKYFFINIRIFMAVCVYIFKYKYEYICLHSVSLAYEEAHGGAGVGGGVISDYLSELEGRRDVACFQLTAFEQLSTDYHDLENEERAKADVPYNETQKKSLDSLGIIMFMKIFVYICKFIYIHIFTYI